MAIARALDMVKTVASGSGRDRVGYAKGALTPEKTFVEHSSSGVTSSLLEKVSCGSYNSVGIVPGQRDFI